MADLAGLDNFMNDASDQAAAWYSIISGNPPQIPSATITQQQNLAAVSPALQSAGLFSPLVILVVAGVVVLWLLNK